MMLRPKEATEADRIFKALAEGGMVQIPIAETFWALRFGQLVDPFGVPRSPTCDELTSSPSGASNAGAVER